MEAESDWETSISNHPDGILALEGFEDKSKEVITLELLDNIISKIEKINPNLTKEEIQQIIHKIKFNQHPQEELQKFDKPAIAAHDGENNKILIFENFFNKTEDEQTYILAHEISHALLACSGISPDERIKLNSLLSSTKIDEETKYIQKMYQYYQQGTISQQELLSEMLAERMTSLILCKGQLSEMVALQSLRSENKSIVSNYLLQDLSKEELEISLSTSEDPSITRIRQYRDILLHSISLINNNPEEDEKNFVEFDDELPLFISDSEELADNLYMTDQPSRRKRSPSFWDLLKIILSA